MCDNPYIYQRYVFRRVIPPPQPIGEQKQLETAETANRHCREMVSISAHILFNQKSATLPYNCIGVAVVSAL